MPFKQITPRAFLMLNFSRKLALFLDLKLRIYWCGSRFNVNSSIYFVVRNFMFTQFFSLGLFSSLTTFCLYIFIFVPHFP